MTHATPTLRRYDQLDARQRAEARKLTEHNNVVLRAFLGATAPAYAPQDVAYYVGPMGHLDGRILPLPRKR